MENPIKAICLQSLRLFGDQTSKTLVSGAYLRLYVNNGLFEFLFVMPKKKLNIIAALNIKPSLHIIRKDSKHMFGNNIFQTVHICIGLHIGVMIHKY